MTLQDVARAAGVSRSTVSRVVNDDPRVSDAVRKRVRQTIQEMGFQPNAAARTLASQRSHAIGVVVPEDFSRQHVDTWYTSIIEACLTASRNAGLALFLVMEDSSDPRSSQRLAEQYLHTARLDGVLVLQHSYRDLLSPGLVARDVPHVLIGESESDVSSWVDNDNFAGGYAAAEHLISHGARRPAIIVSRTEHVPTARRAEGFREACVHLGVEVTSPGEAGYGEHGVTEVMHTLLRSDDRPDAIFAVNGWMVSAVYAVIHEHGLSVPDDLKVITYDNFEPEIGESLGVTTMVQQVSGLAERAVSLLVELVEKRAIAPVSIVLHSDVIQRGSCGEPVTSC